MTAAWGEAPARPEWSAGGLEARWVAPPFSVLDSRQGYWQERRRAWLSLGIRGELGRAAAAFTANETVAAGVDGTGTSVFDPVLAEVALRWWAPAGGRVLDPFAGGSVRGIVSARLGHPYVGVDLSARQVEEDRRQGAEILLPGDAEARWLVGDARRLGDVLPAGETYDLVLTCPPYYDLEVYSDDPADLSAAPTYEAFLAGYGEALRGAVARLRDGRFAVVVVGEVRAPDGTLRGLVPATVRLMEEAGARWYNDAVLVNSIGSLPVRVGQYMAASRKLGRSHQYLLVFVRGRPPGRDEWSHERPAPPSPQLDLGLAGEA